jgi:hypothetical protein
VVGHAYIIIMWFSSNRKTMTDDSQLCDSNRRIMIIAIVLILAFANILACLTCLVDLDSWALFAENS